MDGEMSWIGCVVWIPCIVGTVLYTGGLHKAGLYLILANMVLLLLLYSWNYFRDGQYEEDDLVTRNFLVVVTFLLGVTITCIVMLVFAYKNGDKVNYFFFHVDQVDLTQFDLIAASASPPVLNYTMSLKVSLGQDQHGHVHEEEKVEYYEELKAWAYYQGHNFTYLSLLSPKDSCSGCYYNSSSGTLRLVFQGQQKLVLTGDGLTRYGQDAAAGQFSFAVTLSYSGFRTGKGWTDDRGDVNNETAIIAIRAKEYSDPVKGLVTFQLKDVPLSTLDINGGPVTGRAAAVA